MWLKRNILVATDFGEHSRAAADLALEVAQQAGMPLVLVHSYQVPVNLYAGVPLPSFADYIQAYENAAREMLEKEALRIANHGVPVSPVLRRGAVWEEILAVAKELDVGLIVLGTHGRRGLPRALLGSVAEKVVRMSPIPVLTMREPPHTAAAIDRTSVAGSEGHPNIS